MSFIHTERKNGMVLRVLGIHPCERWGLLGTVACRPCPASQESMVPCTASPGKDQNSKV